MAQETVGIIGVGLMGLGIATNVQKAGYALHFLDHPGNQPTEKLAEQGAIAHTCAEALAAACDKVILCVTGAPQVEAVIAGPTGVLSGLKPGSLIIDCSTSLPDVSRKMASAVQDKGGRYIDAPMTRTPKEAAEGRLNLIVGGAAGDIENARPVLESFSENISLAGEIGTGHTMKLLHNFVSLGFSAVLTEAAAVARDSGVTGEVFQEILAKGGGAGVVLDRLTPYILQDDCGAFLFSLSNCSKDTGYYRDMVEQVGSAHGMADAVEHLYSSMAEKGHGEVYVPELIELLRKG